MNTASNDVAAETPVVETSAPLTKAQLAAKIRADKAPEKLAKVTPEQKAEFSAQIRASMTAALIGFNALAPKALEVSKARDTSTSVQVRAVAVLLDHIANRGTVAQIYGDESTRFFEDVKNNVDGIAVDAGCKLSEKTKLYLIPATMSVIKSEVLKAIREGINFRDADGTTKSFPKIRTEAKASVDKKALAAGGLDGDRVAIEEGLKHIRTFVMAADRDPQAIAVLRSGVQAVVDTVDGFIKEINSERNAAKLAGEREAAKAKAKLEAAKADLKAATAKVSKASTSAAKAA